MSGFVDVVQVRIRKRADRGVAVEADGFDQARFVIDTPGEVFVLAVLLVPLRGVHNVRQTPTGLETPKL